MHLSPEQQDLWSHIEAHTFDDPDATQTFAARLAAENGWTSAFARRAIEEYLRYAFLYAVDGQPVSPPPIVDQVWHLHLIYTRNYWDIFCKEVLRRSLHHEPATGVVREKDKLGDWYTSTIERYRTHFGDPPDDIWPEPAALASTPQTKHQWVDIENVVMLPRGVLYVVAALVLALIVVAVAALMENAGGD